ncbi:MAG TPA: hypothetical protein VK563_14655 [Puia sp.]|nr:hypothetical protein [Puia sp.]
MQLSITDNLGLFCIAFGAMQLFIFLMGLQDRHFYTKDVVVRKFRIMGLELAATAREIVNLIKGLYLLPDPAQSKKAVLALKRHLYIDFLFMPCAYLSIFLVCMHVSGKMITGFGQEFFVVMAWAQALPWLCDIIGNVYLLRKIRPDPVQSTDGVHSAYLHMEALKWGLTLIAAVSALSTECYFWLSNNYSPESLRYLLIIIGEILVFGIAGKLAGKNPHGLSAAKAAVTSAPPAAATTAAAGQKNKTS